MSSQFATYGFAFALLLLCCSPASAQNTATDVQIHIESKIITGHISPDFIGFGYETSAAAQTNYFSGQNDSLIHLYRNLTTNGLIRIGGNISDHTKYVPDGIAMVNTQDKVTVINHASLDHVAAFARATGWHVMWGLNLGTGTKAEAAQEAIDVAATFGDRLQSFQIGNEVDFHSHYDDKVTDYASYHSNYLAFKTAIRAVVPMRPFPVPTSAITFAGSAISPPPSLAISNYSHTITIEPTPKTPTPLLPISLLPILLGSKGSKRSRASHKPGACPTASTRSTPSPAAAKLALVIRLPPLSGASITCFSSLPTDATE